MDSENIFKNPAALRKWIDGLSIRGRMAYGVLCVENACDAFGIASATITVLLDDFWKFTSTKRLDHWEQTILPWHRFISAFSDEFLKDRDWNEFAADWAIDHLSEDRQIAFGRLLVFIEAIGVDNLYSGFESDITAEPLIEIISVLKNFHMPLPETSRVSLCKSSENGGWGDLHGREFFVAG